MTRLTRALALAGSAWFCCLAPSALRASSIRRRLNSSEAADIKWVRNAAGTQETATLFGDPTKPGPT